MKKMTATKQARDIKKTADAERYNQIKQNWENKLLYGKYPLRSQNADVNRGNTQQ